VLRQAIQTSAPINPGNSGGALVDIGGQVIGIPTVAATNPENGGAAPGIGFAVPSDIVTDISNQIVTKGRVVNSHRAALGISGITVTDDRGQPGGVALVAVEAGGPAAVAGLQPGDVIIKIDDTPVTTLVDLQNVLAQLDPGAKIEVTVARRSGGTETVTVTLGELPGSPR
jgi:S1-C subfamily serine protease